MNLRQMVVMLGLMATTAMSFGFIEGKPEGAQFHSEQSQEQVADQQRYNGNFGPVGEVQLDQSDKNRPGIGSEDQAAQTLIQSEEQQGKATEVLKQAEKERQSSGPWRMILIALAAVGVVGVVLFGLKRYAEQHAPKPPSPTRTKW